MNQIGKLIELLKANSYLDVLDDEHWHKAAEQLIANGMIVPPCKVGDTVYAIFGEFEPYVAKCRVDEFLIERGGVYAVMDVYYGDFVARRNRSIPIDWFGKTVFLSREEAERSGE